MELQKTHVKQNKNHYEPKVSPMVGVLDVEVRPEELVCGANRAELAATGSTRVGEITTGYRYVILHVVPARLAGRRSQGHQLDGHASDILFSDS
jgi:phage host-nuclease inhibitor protein Gam